MSRYSSKEIQKSTERNQIAQFKSLFQSDRNLDIKIIEKDPPDAEVFFEGQKIAIELTELVWDNDIDGVNKKAHESNADMIMDMAKMEYEKLFLPPVRVSVRFNDNYGLIKEDGNLQLSSSDKKRLSNYIVDKVVKFLPLQDNMSVDVPEYNKNWERVLDQKISAINIYRSEFLFENCWITREGGTSQRITTEKLITRIRSKERCLKNYQDSFDNLWLVLVEDWKHVSDWFDFKYMEEIQAKGFESIFDRIFIMRSKKNELIELNLVKK